MIVAPGQKHAIALRPEFITPQDGHTKQDCEIAAGKRWLEAHASYYLPGLGYNVTYLGDDVYAHQPFCRQVWLHQGHFIFVCKPESHTHLYNWVNLLEEGRDLHTAVKSPATTSLRGSAPHAPIRSLKPPAHHASAAPGQLAWLAQHSQHSPETRSSRLNTRFPSAPPP